MLTKLLPVKQKNNQINVLVILENTYADSLFFDSLVHLVEKYNSNINYYIIDNFNTDSDDHKYYEGNYSYGPYYIYRSYMREYFFNSNIYYDKFKIEILNMNIGCKIRQLMGHTNDIECVIRFGEDKLISCSRDETIRVWSLVNKGECLSTLRGHTNSVKCVKLLKNGHLASGSVDRLIKIWNLKYICCLFNSSVKISTFFILSFFRQA